ncbi:MAG: MarR family transcriptional regulator [Fimbriimonadia bacterium]|nr:MarR family transcriptional regulator [Fimbriimonadia bacterium]
MTIDKLRLPIALSEDLLNHAEMISQVFAQAMYKTIGEHMTEELSESELTYAQMQALRYLRNHRRVMVGDMADGLGISYPSATNMVNRLEKKGWIERIPNPRDRRQVGIKITESGAQLVHQIDQERKHRFAAILTKMEPEERHAFINGLRAFIRTGMENDILPPDEICLHCGTQQDPLCPIRASKTEEFCR